MITSEREVYPTTREAALMAAQESLAKLNASKQPVSVSDGSTASYYELPPWARELADLIRYKRMNGSQAEMFRALYRGSEASHSDEKRQAKKLLAYAVDEVVRTHFPEESFAKYRNDVFEAIFGATE